MKIMCVIPSLHRGGAERVMSTLTRQWAKSHDVVLAVFDSSAGAYSYGGRMSDLQCQAAPTRLRKIIVGLHRVFRLQALMRKERPDRIITFMESANFPATLAAALTGNLSKLSVSVRNDPSRFTALQQALLPIIYRLPRRVVAVSKGVSMALQGMGIPKTKVNVIPNPVELAALPPPNVPTSQQHFPERFILAVGRLHKQKGFDLLLKAFAALQNPKVNLVILGEGLERSNLEKLSRQLAIDNRLHMPGVVNDVTPWYRAAECFVLSSRHEGWPNVLMEAMANGCATVSFNCPFGPDEILENGHYGLLVEAGDIDALAKALSSLLDEPQTKRAHFALAGPRRARHFDAPLIAAQWLDNAHD